MWIEVREKTESGESKAIDDREWREVNYITRKL